MSKKTALTCKCGRPGPWGTERRDSALIAAMAVPCQHGRARPLREQQEDPGHLQACVGKALER
eukprot:12125213-Alexandrium_andersonii.AAC.1